MSVQEQTEFKISQRLLQLQESATIAVSNRAAALRREGIDVVSLGAGEPDFPTPEHIRKHAFEIIEAGETKYAKPASGVPESKAAVAEKFRRENSLEYEPSQILITVGGKEGLWLAFATILDPGDEVIIPAPYWVSYPEQVKITEGVPVFLETTVKEEFKITPNQLQRALTPRTRAVIFNSPSNPSGSVYTPDEIDALSEVLRDRDDIVIISDEIYDRLLYGGRKSKSFAATSQHAYARTLTFNSGSKTYAMTGWRIGYVAGHPKFIRNMGKLQSQTTSGAATFTMHALAAALTGDQSCVEQMRSEFQIRAKYLHSRLNAMQGVVCPEPAGAFYVFPDVSATYSNLGISGSIDWTTRLLSEEHLALVPGAAFGLDSCVRLSFATSMDVLQEGLDRLENFLA